MLQRHVSVNVTIHACVADKAPTIILRSHGLHLSLLAGSRGSNDVTVSPELQDTVSQISSPSAKFLCIAACGDLGNGK